MRLCWFAEHPHLIHGFPIFHSRVPDHSQGWFDLEIGDFGLELGQAHWPDFYALVEIKPLVHGGSGDSRFFLCLGLGGGFGLCFRFFDGLSTPDFLIELDPRRGLLFELLISLGDQFTSLFLCRKRLISFRFGVTGV